MKKRVKKWLSFSTLVILTSFPIEAQKEKDKFSWLDRIDFYLVGSLDLAFSQTPLHYLSYLGSDRMAALPPDLKLYLKDARTTVSNGVGFGGILGVGYYLKSNSSIRIGLEYQISSAGSEASRLWFPSQDQNLFLSAGYLDHRLRGYVRLIPKFHKKLAFSVSVFMGLTIIQLQEFVVRLERDNINNYYDLVNLKYSNGSRIFKKNTYTGFDIGFRGSLFMLDAGFDLAIAQIFVIPRFVVGFSLNHETLKVLIDHGR